MTQLKNSGFNLRGTVGFVQIVHNDALCYYPAWRQRSKSELRTAVDPLLSPNQKVGGTKCFIFLTLNNLIALLETKNPFLVNIFKYSRGKDFKERILKCQTSIDMHLTSE